mgnify:CR=1 FL=1
MFCDRKFLQLHYHWVRWNLEELWKLELENQKSFGNLIILMNFDATWDSFEQFSDRTFFVRNYKDFDQNTANWLKTETKSNL